jgi:hypothetical protein
MKTWSTVVSVKLFRGVLWFSGVWRMDICNGSLQCDHQSVKQYPKKITNPKGVAVFK